MNEKLLLDVNEVASLLGCGRTYVYGMIQRKELPVIKLGRLTKVPRLAVDEYVDLARFPQSSVQQAAVPASWPTTAPGPRR